MTDTGIEVRRILIEVLRLSLPPAELGDDTRLLDGGLGLDSLAGLKLVMAVEQRYGFTFDADDLSRESLATVGSFVALVEERVPTGSATAST